jgi:hypothetical protein
MRKRKPIDSMFNEVRWHVRRNNIRRVPASLFSSILDITKNSSGRMMLKIKGDILENIQIF